MGTTLSGKVLRAAGALCPKMEAANAEVHAYVRVRPSLDEQTTDIEAISGQAALRVRVPGIADEDVLIDRETTQRLMAEDAVVIEGNEVLRPFHLPVERADGSTPRKLTAHDIDDLLPDSTRRVAFSISPKALAAVMQAVAKVGVNSVDIMLPAVRGGAIGFRGQTGDDRTVVSGAILPSNLYGASANEADAAATSPETTSERGLPGPSDPPGLPFTPNEDDSVEAAVATVLEDDETCIACDAAAAAHCRECGEATCASCGCSCTVNG